MAALGENSKNENQWRRKQKQRRRRYRGDNIASSSALAGAGSASRWRWKLSAYRSINGGVAAWRENGVAASRKCQWRAAVSKKLNANGYRRENGVIG
jgi:hypothetical protein